MKKNIKKLLSAQASQILPDDGVKENIKSELGYAAPETSRAYAHGGAEAHGRRAAVIAVTAFAAALVLCLCILLPALFRGGESKLPSNGKFGQIETTEDFYAYGAASIGSLLVSDDAAVKTLSASTPSDDQMEIIERYMSLANGLLSEGNIEYTAKSVSGGEYDFEMTVKYVDLSGNLIAYEMYYNRIYIDGEKDGDETEAEYSIEGVLIAAGVRYPVQGTLETESEDGERESELKFRAYTSKSYDSYIEVHREIEEEVKGDKTESEQKYVYGVYENGRRTERTTVEYEEKDGVPELVMVVERANGEKDVLMFEQKKKSDSTLYVYAELNGIKTEFTVSVKTDGNGRTYYEYAFGTQD